MTLNRNTVRLAATCCINKIMQIGGLVFNDKGVPGGNTSKKS